MGEITEIVALLERPATRPGWVAALSRNLAARVCYLGVQGPRHRTDRLRAELGGGAVPAQLHAPVGLDLGGDTLEAVALAILAEMQCRLAGRAPIHLRDRAAPIHG